MCYNMGIGIFRGTLKTMEAIVELLDLTCRKCGSNLDFGGKFITTCSACGTPHALVSADDNGLVQISYLPVDSTPDGKMKISLKLKLVQKLRDNTEYVLRKSEEWWSLDRSSDDGKYLRKYEITEEGDSFEVIEIYTTEREESHGNWLLGVSNETISVEHYRNICEVSVFPVEVDGYLVGHQILILVHGIEFEDKVNAISAQIQEWFGVVPEVLLDSI